MELDRELANDIHRYMNQAADQRERDADKRSAALIRAHETGWKLVADALYRGLADIAAAIRDHGRK